MVCITRFDLQFQKNFNTCLIDENAFNIVSQLEKPAARGSHIKSIRNQNSRLRSVQNYFNETQTLGQTSQIV